VGVFAGIARTTRRGSRKGRRSSAKEVSNFSTELITYNVFIDPLFDLMYSVYQIAKFYFLLLLFVLKCKHIFDEEYIINFA